MSPSLSQRQPGRGLQPTLGLELLRLRMETEVVHERMAAERLEKQREARRLLEEDERLARRQLYLDEYRAWQHVRAAHNGQVRDWVEFYRSRVPGYRFPLCEQLLPGRDLLTGDYN